MKGSQLGSAHVMMELSRLLRVFKRPAHAPDDLAAFASDYIEVCADVSAEQFTQGVNEYLKSAARFFPKPGELRAQAKAQPGLNAGVPLDEFESWMQRGFRDHVDGTLSPCPACGRAWQWHPRLKIVHDHARHRALSLPCVGACDRVECLGPSRIEGAPHRQSAGELWDPPVPLPMVPA